MLDARTRTGWAGPASQPGGRWGGAGFGARDLAPGQGPVFYPAMGPGVRHRATDQLVIEIHYNLANPGHQGPQRFDDGEAAPRGHGPAAGDLHADRSVHRDGGAGQAGNHWRRACRRGVLVERGRPVRWVCPRARRWSWWLMPHMHTRGGQADVHHRRRWRRPVRGERRPLGLQLAEFSTSDRARRPARTAEGKRLVTCQYLTGVRRMKSGVSGWGRATRCASRS